MGLGWFDEEGGAEGRRRGEAAPQSRRRVVISACRGVVTSCFLPVFLLSVAIPLETLSAFHSVVGLPTNTRGSG